MKFDEYCGKGNLPKPVRFIADLCWICIEQMQGCHTFRVWRTISACCGKTVQQREILAAFCHPGKYRQKVSDPGKGIKNSAGKP
jgi:hypothetical protein